MELANITQEEIQDAKVPPIEKPTSSNVDLTLDELLPFAMALHREGRRDGAQQCYEALLRHQPDNANALHYLGVLQHQRGQNRAALELIQRSLAIDAGVAAWHNNLGNVLLDQGQFEAAAQSYRRCVDLDEGNTEVRNNLGVLYGKIDQPVQAEKVLLQAIALAPKNVEARNNLSNLYGALGRFEEAFSHFADALALSPQSRTTRRLLTVAYGRAGRVDDGLQSCRDWLELEPDNVEAQHFFAAYGGTATPERASDAYVQSEFDGFAMSFDAKLAALEYRAPQLVGQEVARILGQPRDSHEILDAGCGTGLCAPFLRPFARRLVGVDLSANMLERAREKSNYDELVQAELVSYLGQFDAAYDLVVSADTLCYFGRLDSAFLAVRRALRPGGHWMFTVEGHELEQDFKLHTHGRYSHARGYLAAALDQTGFANVGIVSVDLRLESGVPVKGWLVCAA